jgi:hypothetical protein
MVRYRTLVWNRPLTHPREPSSAAVVADYLTGGEPLCLVNHVDLVNATGAADVALAHQSVALVRYLFGTKSISPILKIPENCCNFAKIISNSNKIRKMQIIYQNDHKHITYLFKL